MEFALKQKVTVFYQLIPIFLSMFMLSAHYLRYANMIGLVTCIMVPFLLFIRNKVVVRIIQFSLLVAIYIWIDTLLNLISIREQLGQDWERMAIIFAGVILFTLLSGLVFYTKTLRKRYGLVKGF